MEILYYKTTQGSSRLSRPSQSNGRPNRIGAQAKNTVAQANSFDSANGFSPSRRLGSDRGSLPAVAAKGRAKSLIVRREKAARHKADLAPVIEELRAQGATSLRAIASGLNAMGVRAPRGGAWSAAQVRALGV